MLLVGFEAYGGRGLNPAAEICNAIDGHTIAGTTVRGAVLPVRYEEMVARLDALINRHDPSALICLGLWPGEGLCCTNPVRDSSCESSVVAELHEQTHTPHLQDQELASL
jgi:pyrrolidone-carboxylate peptidase